MSDIAINVENISKRYRIGLKESTNNSLVGAVAGFAIQPLKNLRRLRRLSQFGDGNNGAEDTIWALKDMSFEVMEGERVGIIGRNGAGKSTLLKVITGITEPTDGRVTTRGRVSSLLEVGTGFHSELTGRENVYLNGTVLGMGRQEIARKFDEIVAFAEVEKFIDTPVKRYSSGMLVRLAFAVAAHLEPEILLVDEVLAVGDYMFQRKCLDKISDMTAEGRTVLLVSHNMASIMSICQRAILLEDGRVIQDGPVDLIVAQYLESGRTNAGEVVWQDPQTAPGNDTVRLHAVRVLQEGTDGPVTEVNASLKVDAEIEYWNLKDDTCLYAGIVLRDKMSIPVLQSINSPALSRTEDPLYGRPLPRGLFRSVCQIPAELLNEGRYSITALVGMIPLQQIIHEADVVSFQAVITDDPLREYYAGCLIRPRLCWQTDCIGES